MVIIIQKDYCQTNGWTKLNPEIKKKKENVGGDPIEMEKTRH